MGCHSPGSVTDLPAKLYRVFSNTSIPLRMSPAAKDNTMTSFPALFLQPNHEAHPRSVCPSKDKFSNYLSEGRPHNAWTPVSPWNNVTSPYARLTYRFNYPKSTPLTKVRRREGSGRRKRRDHFPELIDLYPQ